MQVQTEISLLDHRLSMIEDQLDELKKELSEVSTKTTQLVDALSDNPLTQKKGISSDIKELKKNKGKFAIWRLEQLINFGLGEERLKIKELKKYWYVIDIDPFKRKFLALFMN